MKLKLKRQLGVKRTGLSSVTREAIRKRKTKISNNEGYNIVKDEHQSVTKNNSLLPREAEAAASLVMLSQTLPPLLSNNVKSSSNVETLSNTGKPSLASSPVGIRVLAIQHDGSSPQFLLPVTPRTKKKLCVTLEPLSVGDVLVPRIKNTSIVKNKIVSTPDPVGLYVPQSPSPIARKKSRGYLDDASVHNTYNIDCNAQMNCKGLQLKQGITSPKGFESKSAMFTPRKRKTTYFTLDTSVGSPSLSPPTERLSADCTVPQVHQRFVSPPVKSTSQNTYSEAPTIISQICTSNAIKDAVCEHEGNALRYQVPSYCISKRKIGTPRNDIRIMLEPPSIGSLCAPNKKQLLVIHQAGTRIALDTSPQILVHSSPSKTAREKCRSILTENYVKRHFELLHGKRQLQNTIRYNEALYNADRIDVVSEQQPHSPKLGSVSDASSEDQEFNDNFEQINGITPLPPASADEDINFPIPPSIPTNETELLEVENQHKKRTTRRKLLDRFENVCKAANRTGVSYSVTKYLRNRKKIRSMKCKPLFDKDVIKKFPQRTWSYYYLKKLPSKVFRRLTGVTQQLFEALYSFIGGDEVCYRLKYNYSKKTPRRMKRNILTPKDRLCLTLIRLKRGFFLSDIALIFGVTQSTASDIFYVWIQLLYVQFKRMQKLMFTSRHDQTGPSVPPSFKRFKNFRVIIDSTEVKIQVPYHYQQQGNTYSDYKSGNVINYLIGCTCWGSISYVSPGYEGSISDKELFENSGITDFLEADDLILADRGFLITDITDELKVKVVTPPFLNGRDKFTPEEDVLTKEIAATRIHVERSIRKVKCFELLKRIKNNMLPILDQIVYVAGCLVNFDPPNIVVEE